VALAPAPTEPEPGRSQSHPPSLFYNQPTPLPSPLSPFKLCPFFGGARAEPIIKKKSQLLWAAAEPAEPEPIFYNKIFLADASSKEGGGASKKKKTVSLGLILMINQGNNGSEALPPLYYHL
jgi:hypothetical protein